MMQTQDYKINLDLFEGPLDLLLHLIRKEDVAITDIPIAPILDQYIAHLELLKELNIDVAGEFILMSAELSHLKSQWLLYQVKSDEEDGGPDPRADLVARLLEYQRYKFAADWLLGRPLLSRDIYKRPEVSPGEENWQEEEMIAVEPFALLSAFNEILKRLPQGQFHEVQMERVSVAERMYEILEELNRKTESILFEDLFEGVASRSRFVVTFLAILEMARLKMIAIYQTNHNGVIRITKKMETLYGENQTEGHS